MNRLVSLLTTRKALLLTIVFCATIIFVMSSISFTQISSMNIHLINLSAWIKAHKFPFLFWHGVILVAIYSCWGLKVDRAVKQKKIRSDSANSIKKFRYWLMAFVLLTDLLVYWY